MPSIERPTATATVLDPLAGSPDRLATFETARGSARRDEIMDAVDTSYDVVARYLDDMSDTLLDQEQAGKQRVYAPSLMGSHVGASIDIYRDNLSGSSRDADSYLGAALDRLTPERLAVFDYIVETGEASTDEIQQLLEAGAESSRKRVQPLEAEELVSKETIQSPSYSYTPAATTAQSAIHHLPEDTLIDGFRVLRNGDSYRLLAEWEAVDSLPAFAETVDVSQKTVYNWRDGLDEAGLIEENGEIYDVSPAGRTLRNILGEPSDDVSQLAAALQSRERVAIFEAAAGRSCDMIAEETGFPLKKVRNLVSDITSRGLLAQKNAQGAVYRPGPLADAVHPMLLSVDEGIALQENHRAAEYIGALVQGVEESTRIAPVAEELGVPEATVRGWGRRCAEAGWLEQTGDGPDESYRVTPAGRTAADLASGNSSDPFDMYYPDIPDPFTTPQELEQFAVIAGVLHRGGGVEDAAALLDLHPETVRSQAADFIEAGYLQRTLDRTGSRGSDAHYYLGIDGPQQVVNRIEAETLPWAVQRAERTGDAVDEATYDERVEWAVQRGGAAGAALNETTCIERMEWMIQRGGAAAARVDAATYEERVGYELRSLLPEEKVDTAAAMAAVYLGGGTDTDVATTLDISEDRARRLRDTLFIDNELAEVEGWGPGREYCLDADLREATQRYLEVYEPEAALHIAAGTADAVNQDTGLRARAAYNAGARNLVEEAELPESFDIWEQVNEFLMAAHIASQGQGIAPFGEYIGEGRTAAKRRLDTLEERDALLYRTLDKDTEFTFAPWTRGLIAQYADSYDINIDVLEFQPLAEARRDELFDDAEEYEDLLGFARATVIGQGLAAFTRHREMDREAAEERFNRLEEHGYITRESAGHGFIFDEQLRPLLEAEADRFTDIYDRDVDPLNCIQFRDIEQFKANQARQDQIEAEENNSGDMRWTDYKGGGETDEDTTIPNGHGRPDPDILLANINWYDLAGQSVEGLADDINEAVNAGEDLATINQRIDGGRQAVEIRSVNNNDVIGVSGEGRVRMDPEQYRRVRDEAGDLEGDYVVVIPGKRDALTGFYDVKEVVGAFRER